MFFLIGSVAVPNALATPLVLIFDDALHTPIEPIAAHEPTAGATAGDTPTPHAAPNVAFTGTGLMAFTLNAQSAGGAHAVPDALLKTQVSSAVPLTLGSFRVVTPVPGK
jgi:hypothetical protein